MRLLLPSILTLLLSFPSLVLSESLWDATVESVLSLSTSLWGETVDCDDLVERDGLYYKKHADVPFTGGVEGEKQGRAKDGKKEGEWIEYWTNGQLRSKGTYNNGKKEGLWKSYDENGIKTKYAGLYKNGKKASE